MFLILMQYPIGQYEYTTHKIISQLWLNFNCFRLRREYIVCHNKKKDDPVLEMEDFLQAGFWKACRLGTGTFYEGKK